MSTVHVLGNPTAGRGHAARVLADVVTEVRRRGDRAVLLEATSRADALNTLRRAVDDGAERVVLVGGDGLAHLAVQAIATTKVVLGMVPVGTGNDFARALGIHRRNLTDAVGRALSEPTSIDAIRTNHGWVASVATLGFAATVNERANALRFPRGAARYTVATMRELPTLTPTPLHIELDGVGFDVDATMVAIANTRFFGGGMAICPDADPRDGRLDVLVVESVSRATLLRFFPRVFRGTHVSHPRVRMLTGRELRIEHRAPLARDAGLWGDGEPMGPLPTHVEVVPEALHIAGVAQL